MTTPGKPGRPRKTDTTPSDTAIRAARLRDDGLSFTVIAQRLGISVSSARDGVKAVDATREQLHNTNLTEIGVQAGTDPADAPATLGTPGVQRLHD